MCKCWLVTYTCKHTHTFRLSKCRGTILTASRRSMTALCSTYPALEMTSPSLCGPCARAAKFDDLETQLSDFFKDRPGGLWAEETEETVEGGKFKADHDRKVWNLETEFPRQQRQKPARPGHRRFSAHTKGPLWNELKPEDIEESETWAGWYGSSRAWDYSRDGWAEEGYLTLAEEIEERTGEDVNSLDCYMALDDPNSSNDEATTGTDMDTDLRSWNDAVESEGSKEEEIPLTPRTTVSTPQLSSPLIGNAENEEPLNHPVMEKAKRPTIVREKSSCCLDTAKQTTCWQAVIQAST